jgi:hypothetical protein
VSPKSVTIASGFRRGGAEIVASNTHTSARRTPAW